MMQSFMRIIAIPFLSVQAEASYSSAYSQHTPSSGVTQGTDIHMEAGGAVLLSLDGEGVLQALGVRSTVLPVILAVNTCPDPR
jgi:hypothetical protein